MEKMNKIMFDEYVKAEKETCVILCSRKTCHVCQALHPLLEEIQTDYADADLKFYSVDVEAEAELFAGFRLKGVPQVLFFKNGVQTAVLSGQHEEDAYIDAIEGILG